MRIAIIADSKFPVAEPFAGGLESHVWHLARSLRRRGHLVTLYAGSGSDTDVASRVLPMAHLRATPAARRDVSMPEESWMNEHHAYLDLMLRLGRDLDGAFDVIHNHSLHYLPVAMAPTVRTPIVTTLHTPPTPWLESAVKASGASNVRFVAVSQQTADVWSSVIPDVAVIHNGVDLTRWTPGPGGGNLIWLGRLVAEKAPHLAVLAARRAGIPIDIAGHMHDRVYFERELRPLLGPGVRYLGHLTQAALGTALGLASASVVTPLWDEPYGLVVAESLACGTPVAAFDRGGIPEILSMASGVLVPGGDVAGLAAALPVAMRLPRQCALDRAMAFCDIENMVDSYLDLFRASVDLAA
jgi:glycosyltransferase involved in cell wall biosynthesis